MKTDRLIRRTHAKKSASAFTADVKISERLSDSDIGNGAALFEKTPTTYISAVTQGEKALTAPRFDTTEDIIAWAAAALAQSPEAGAIVRHAQEQNWQIGFSDLHNGGFHIDIPAKKIFIDNFSLTPAALGRSLYFRNAFLISLIRALRDVWHEDRTGSFENEYPPEQALMMERVRAADCDTFSVFVAWELRGAGNAEIWRHLLGSAEGDMAMIFVRFLERSPAALFDGTALAYVFRQWYADEERVAACDHQTLETLDDIVLALTEMGTESGCLGQKELTPAAMEFLSVLPGGICYLAGLGRTIMTDPFFAGLNDPVNQTHLYHLMYDMEVTMVNNVPFRDTKLARRIFPGGEIVKTRL